MKILGIETSCDETAAAVVRDGREILSNVVVSQIDIFAEYGGVIPEVAARSHLEAMMPVVDKALADAGCSWDDISAIAVTHAPGLLGSLLIGTLTARTLAILHDKPLYAVHHLKSHVYANWLNGERADAEPIFSDAGLEFSSTSYAGEPAEPPLWGEPVGRVRNIRVENSNRAFMHPRKTGSAARVPSFPLLALVVSGGHTQILYMREHNQFEIVGTTRDDAVGECFDKVAKILGLPYPGGPAIARVAKGEAAVFRSGPRPAGPSGETGLPRSESRASSAFSRLVAPSPRAAGAQSRAAALRKSPSQNMAASLGSLLRYKLPHPKVEGLDFSFSGLKTAVLRAVQKEVGVDVSYPSYKLKDLLSPQQVADFAASFQRTAIEILVEKMQAALAQYPEVKTIVVAGGVSANKALREALPEAYFPEPSLSGDNGAMVAAAAYYEIQSGVKPTDPYALNIYPRITIE